MAGVLVGCAGWAEGSGTGLTIGRGVQLVDDVALVLGVGNFEALLGEEPRDAILLQLSVVQQVRDCVLVSCVRGSSASLGAIHRQ